MVSPTQPLQRAVRRLALTTKQAGRGFYKGNRTGSMGSFVKNNRFVINPNKVRTYVVPDLSDFTLTPFVEEDKTASERAAQEGEGLSSETETLAQMNKSNMTGQRFLERWKASTRYEKLE